MKALKEAILRDGVGIGNDIVKVDSFLNHRIDVALSTQMGQAFYEAFKDERVDCILTVEASGIAVAITTAQAFGGIPVVFAKKGAHRNVGHDVYTAQGYSFTHQTMNTVRVSRKYLPQTAGALDDPRVSIHYEDGLRYVRTRENEYDLIIVDSTDPFGPGEGLFTKEFYGNCYKALTEDGIMVNQCESPFYEEDARASQRAHKRIVESFPISKVYQVHIPTYPSGHWLFGFASKKYHPLRDFDPVAWNMKGIKTRYYTTRLHVGAFALPAYVEEMLRDVE